MAASVWIIDWAYRPWPSEARTVERRDDAGGHGVVQAIGVANRHGELADLKRRGVTQRGGGGVLAVKLEHGEIVARSVPRTLADTRRPSSRPTVKVRPSTTWALVSTSPDGS